MNSENQNQVIINYIILLLYNIIIIIKKNIISLICMGLVHVYSQEILVKHSIILDNIFKFIPNLQYRYEYCLIISKIPSNHVFLINILKIINSYYFIIMSQNLILFIYSVLDSE